MKINRWQDWLNLLLGLWLLIAPGVLGFGTSWPAAGMSSVLFGFAIMLFAALAIYMPKAWEEAMNVLLGVCLMASPWLMDFATMREATNNAVIVGLMIAASACWAMLQDVEVRHWLHRHHVG